MAWPRAAGIWLAPVVLLALGVFIILTDGLGLESELSQRLFDAYQRHASRPVSRTAVQVLELPAFDEDRLVQVTRSLSAQGVRLIVFANPPALGPSPQSLSARLPPNSDAARAALAALPEPGHELAQAIAQIQAVLPAVLGEAKTRDEIGPAFGPELTGAEVRYLMTREWARFPEDILWRRSKLGLTMPAADRDALAVFMANVM